VDRYIGLSEIYPVFLSYLWFWEKLVKYKASLIFLNGMKCKRGLSLFDYPEAQAILYSGIEF